jgi:hypothetical protein
MSHVMAMKPTPFKQPSKLLKLICSIHDSLLLFHNTNQN